MLQYTPPTEDKDKYITTYQRSFSQYNSRRPTRVTIAPIIADNAKANGNKCILADYTKVGLCLSPQKVASKEIGHTSIEITRLENLGRKNIR